MTGRIRDDFELNDELPGLRYLGAVDDAALPALYSGALACVYPSLYEGFGLPVLEAMQCGSAVITSQDPAIVEVSGDAVLSVAAEDVEALVEAMSTIVNSVALRKKLGQRGIERAAAFHWRENGSPGHGRSMQRLWGIVRKPCS